MGGKHTFMQNEKERQSKKKTKVSFCVYSLYLAAFGSSNDAKKKKNFLTRAQKNKIEKINKISIKKTRILNSL